MRDVVAFWVRIFHPVENNRLSQCKCIHGANATPPGCPGESVNFTAARSTPSNNPDPRDCVSPCQGTVADRAPDHGCFVFKRSREGTLSSRRRNNSFLQKTK